MVIDAQTGEVLDVWEGVAARPVSPRKTAPAARAAQAVESNLFKIRDANFLPGGIGSTSFVIATTGNPFNYGEDVEFFSAHAFPAGAGILPDAGKLSIDMQFVPKHMCLVRGFCGRDGGFDGTFNQFSITVRTPAQTKPPKNGRGTRYEHSDQRVYMETTTAGSSDILAHELGHLMDLTYGGDRVQGLGTNEVEEALADMYAYDFDRNNATLGETQPGGGFTGSPRINWANPRTIMNTTEKEPYPAHARQFKCNRTDPHFNGTIDSHAYFRFVQKVGHDHAGAVLHLVSQTMGPLPGTLFVRDRFIQRAGELLGNSARNAAIAAWTEVGRAPGNEVHSQHPSCPQAKTRTSRTPTTSVKRAAEQLDRHRQGSRRLAARDRRPRRSRIREKAAVTGGLFISMQFDTPIAGASQGKRFNRRSGQGPSGRRADHEAQRRDGR